MDAEPFAGVAEREVGGFAGNTTGIVVNRPVGIICSPSAPGGSYSNLIPEPPSLSQLNLASTA